MIYDMRTCKLCGKWFKPSHPGELYCCDECRKKAANINKKASLKRIKEREKMAAKPRSKPTVTMNDVLKYMREHDCQYAEAVTNLENQRSNIL